MGYSSDKFLIYTKSRLATRRNSLYIPCLSIKSNLEGYRSFLVILGLVRILTFFLCKSLSRGSTEIYLHILVLPPSFVMFHPIHYPYNSDKHW
jgi:hypothetical protein